MLINKGVRSLHALLLQGFGFISELYRVLCYTFGIENYEQIAAFHEHCGT